MVKPETEFSSRNQNTMRILGTLGALTTAALLSTGASAATVSVDGFNVLFDGNTVPTATRQTVGTDFFGPTNVGTGLQVVRNVTFSVTSNSSPDVAPNDGIPDNQAEISIAAGRLGLSTQQQVTAALDLDYDIGDLFDLAIQADPGASTFSISVLEVFADGGTRRFTPTFNGFNPDSVTSDGAVAYNSGTGEVSSFGEVNVDDGNGGILGPASKTVSFLFSVSDYNLGGPNNFSLGLNAQAGIDVSFEFLEAQFNDAPPEVPAPGAIGLLGLGLAGIGFARRRKAA
jgi:hypothetical protein